MASVNSHQTRAMKQSFLLGRKTPPIFAKRNGQKLACNQQFSELALFTRKDLLGLTHQARPLTFRRSTPATLSPPPKPHVSFQRSCRTPLRQRPRPWLWPLMTAPTPEKLSAASSLGRAADPAAAALVVVDYSRHYPASSRRVPRGSSSLFCRYLRGHCRYCCPWPGWLPRRLHW